MTHPFNNNIGYWTKKIFKDFNYEYEQKLEMYNLTAAQVNVLEQLWVVRDGMTQKELHENLNIRPASLTNLIDILVDGEWVIRKSDSQDARIKRIFLTDKGMDQCKVCMDIIVELEEKVREGFSSEEISLLLVWMKKLHKNINKL
ncbi:MarR family winged helix-turn-helix transcriptional regulator [Peribacillus muralis]|uniref:MarR family winged helix-turn-helix transcriptional regulator n=1 Tax=Peribacillus muralis TaxID=264697 RepID=UPI00070A5159|nr:MarR family transcriptional regulator [Peribacillus muralis]